MARTLLFALSALGLALPTETAVVADSSSSSSSSGSGSGSGCTFYGTGAAGDCLVWDLSALPNRTWMVNDTTSYRDPYLIGPPCGVALCESQCGKQECAGCTSQHAAGLQMHPGQDSATVCSRCFDLGEAPVPSCMLSGGLRLTTTGGYQGRSLVYDFICDQTASATDGPEPGVRSNTNASLSCAPVSTEKPRPFTNAGLGRNQKHFEMLQPRAAGYGALSDAVPGHLAHPAGLPETLARTLPPAIRARSCEVVDLRAKGAAQPADASAVEPHVRHAAQHHRYAV
jgi:hypothetical protein